MRQRRGQSAQRASRATVSTVSLTLAWIGLSPDGLGAGPKCLSSTSPLTLFGVHLDIPAQAPACAIGVAHDVLATAHAGPLVWTLCLGVLGIALVSLCGITGVGVAIRGLLHWIRDWFTRRATALTTQPRIGFPTTCDGPQGPYRLPDLRSVIAGRPPQRRGPPLLVIG